MSCSSAAYSSSSASPSVELVQPPRLVEQRQRQPRHVRAVVLAEVATAGQLHDAAPPQVGELLDQQDARPVARPRSRRRSPRAGPSRRAWPPRRPSARAPSETRPRPRKSCRPRRASSPGMLPRAVIVVLPSFCSSAVQIGQRDRRLVAAVLGAQQAGQRRGRARRERDVVEAHGAHARDRPAPARRARVRPGAPARAGSADRSRGSSRSGG